MSMRVTFVGIGAEQMPNELLSAIIKRQGHQVRLVFNPSLFDDRFQLKMPWLARIFDRSDEVLKEAVATQPDVVAMSVLTNSYRYCVDTARKIKAETGAKIIFGGVHPSAAPEVVIAEDCVDAVCVGEGEVAFPAYLAALEKGSLNEAIPNLWHKVDGEIIRGPQVGFEQDLDSLPFLDKDIYAKHFDIRSLYMTITGRGCPYRCTFCFNNFWAKLPSRSGAKPGRYVRQRSVDHVIAELKNAKRRYGIRFIDFEDDVFTVDKKWIEKFLYQLRREINVPWMCLTHPKYLDEDIIRWMKEAGCTWVQIGIQSVDEHYKKHNMKRYEKQGDVSWAIDEFSRHGIGAKGDHIFGSAGEGIEAQQAALEFYTQHTPARISTFWMTFFPGVEATSDAVARGLLTEKDVDRLNHGHVPAYHEFGAVKDPVALRALVNYEAVFRMLPMIPAALRTKIRPEWLTPIPQSLLSLFSFTSDILVGLAQANPDHILYGMHYLRQIVKHVGRLDHLPGVPPPLPPIDDPTPSVLRSGKLPVINDASFSERTSATG